METLLFWAVVVLGVLVALVQFAPRQNIDINSIDDT
jgi:hypothetical protein